MAVGLSSSLCTCGWFQHIIWPLLSNFKHDCRHPYAPAGLDLFAAMSISGALYCKHINSRLPEGLTSCLTRHMVWQNEGLSLRGGGGGVLLIELLLRSLGTRLPGCPVPRLCVGVTNVVSCSLGTRPPGIWSPG